MDLSISAVSVYLLTVSLELDHFSSHGGDPPQCGFTLCFSDKEDPSSKLIVTQVQLTKPFPPNHKITVKPVQM